MATEAPTEGEAEPEAQVVVEPKKPTFCDFPYLGVVDLTTLRVGSRAPPFLFDAFIPPAEIGQIDLASLKGRWVLIWTFPGLAIPGSVQEIMALGAAAEQFEAVNCYVMGLTNEGPHAAKGLSRVPRVAGGLGEFTLPLAFNLRKEEEDYGKAIFLIDDDGIVRYVDLGAPGVARSVAGCLTLVKASKFVKENAGQACPAGWKEGDPPVPAGGPRKKGSAE